MTLQDPLVGRVVDGRYLVESRIARGGMATVYLALDHRLDREVALKVMHENLAGDEDFVGRFVREARSAARLSHPNVVQVFDQGADGQLLYLAMEYLPGRTLRDVLFQRGALTPREAVSVLESVLGALSAAHRAGIVHGDVKPENVILTDDGRIKVADFGLARAITAPISSVAGGELMGTVAYLAPELVSRGIADVRADVYAAGIVMFELLTGKQPFTGTDPIQVAYRHVNESVPSPSSIAPELPAAFDDVVLRATDRNPGLRPSDADALLADLHAARAQVPSEQMDVRAADAATLRVEVVEPDLDDLPTQAFAAVPGPIVRGPAPAPAVTHQPTRTMVVSRRSARASDRSLTRSGSVGLVPRLKVNDDDGAAPPGFLGDRRRQAVAGILSVLVVIAIIFTGVWWFTGGPGAYTQTPPVTGLTVGDAQLAIKAKGLTPDLTYAFSTQITAGQVISSNPGGGGKVKKNGHVVLLISKGPQLIAVPDVAKKSLSDAITRIQGSGLKVGDTSQKFSNTVKDGSVISTSPKAGSKIAPDREVKLVVSKGAEPVILDNVVNQNVDQAKALLQGKGLKVKIQDQDFQPGGPNPGTVTAQDPAVSQDGQQTTVGKGTSVTLTVVKQPDPIGVPDVRGQNFDQAKSTLEGLGFVVQRDGFNPFANTVSNQSVFGTAPPGTTIVLSVSF
jgi:serine/threonine-protein kinase